MMYYPAFGLFDDFFNDDNENRIMKTDIQEKDGAYQLDMDLPGISKDDIHIELNNGYLTVTASRNSQNEQKDDQGTIIRQERSTGQYARSFYVGDINQNDIKAHFENGELEINVPKDPEQIETDTKYISIQ